ncbi:hypothetical protein E2P81_ATG02275 [Venturia nashicola]|uniref:Uncharacterized protein n=1 Tax=Venturia nashicola TaxID=86259 RepID=A0A4Z1P8L7_9PEZI|nr:hypothetical protein E6O75_ATG02333 [Venturia nashicola]TLD35972.1 hypothetical protein E2P81_ATG02275 [Venturia nashicola]
MAVHYELHNWRQSSAANILLHIIPFYISTIPILDQHERLGRIFQHAGHWGGGNNAINRHNHSAAPSNFDISELGGPHTCILKLAMSTIIDNPTILLYSPKGGIKVVLDSSQRAAQAAGRIKKEEIPNKRKGEKGEKMGKLGSRWA